MTRREKDLKAIEKIKNAVKMHKELALQYANDENWEKVRYHEKQAEKYQAKLLPYFFMLKELAEKK